MESEPSIDKEEKAPSSPSEASHRSLIFLVVYYLLGGLFTSWDRLSSELELISLMYLNCSNASWRVVRKGVKTNQQKTEGLW